MIYKLDKKTNNDLQIRLYIAQMEGNMNVNNADNFLKSLEDESRYQKDVWIS